MGDRPISEETIRVAGIEAFVRRTEGSGLPTLFVHGNPTNSADWIPFMRGLAGPAVAVDLPGFGRSERPGRDRFGGGMHDHAAFLGELIDRLLPDRFRLVVHDWGGIALLPAQQRADRVERLVVINAVPLLPGFRWHWIGRIWRRRGLGEALLAGTTRPGVALLLRQARPGFEAMPPGFVDMVWEAWDRGMARAILDLYRSADPAALEAAGAHLDRLACPALVAWGQQDPYVPAEFGRAYARRLPRSELVEIEDAGHWPWIDRPELIESVNAFLVSRAVGSSAGQPR